MDDLDLGATIRGFSAGQKVFGRFVLQRVLGRGGMGVVWLARDEKLDEPVALKFLPEVVKLDPGALDDLKRETKRARQLTHPNIVRIHDFLEDAHAAAIAMEAVEGTTLAQRRIEQPDRAFEPGALRDWLRQLCTTLDYAHLDARVVHRDLKPANIMVDARGRVKITDFGISQSLTDSLSRASVQRSSSGTPAYMSPQQMMGGKPSPADDIYALGATIYELITSRPPFHSGNLIAQVQSVVPPSMAARRSDFEVPATNIPPEWEATVAACLAKDPAARPATAGEIWTRLNTPVAATPLAPIAASLAPTPAVGAPVPAVAEPPVIRRRASTHTVFVRVFIVLGLVSLLILAGAVVLRVSRATRHAYEKAGPSPDRLGNLGDAPRDQESPVAANLVAPWAAPAPTVEVALAAGRPAQAIHAVSPHPTGVYVTATLADGRAAVLRMTATDSAEIVRHLSAPFPIVAGGGDLYWVDPNSGPVTDTQVWKAPLDGSAAEPVAIYTGSASGEVIVDGGGLAVQWDQSAEAIFGDGPPKVDRLLVVDQVGGRVAAITPASGEIRMLAERRFAGGFASEHPQAIADADDGFFVVGSGRPGVAPPEIVHYPSRDGGEPRVLWSGAPLVAPCAVAHHAEVVFVADPGAGNAIWCLPRDGSAIYRLPVPEGTLQRVAALAITQGETLLVGDAGNGAVLQVSDLPSREGLLFGSKAYGEGVTFGDSGLGLHVEEEGSGEPATDGQRVTLHYLAYDGAGNFVGHSTRESPLVVAVGEATMGAGLDEALRQMRPGAKAQVFVPPSLGSAHFFRDPKPERPGGAILTVIIETVQ